MNKKRALIVVFLAFVLTFVCAFAAACNKKNDDVKNVEVTAVTLNKETVELQLGVSTNITLTATVTPDNATDKTVTWTSSEQSVATVSSSGTVTAVAPGSTTITASAGGKSDTCVVLVRPAPMTVAVTGVSLDKTSVTLKMGETESTTLTPTVLPSNATNKNVTWTSSNTEVATVAGGVVTALKAGTATITVTTADGNKTATCAVTVTAATVTPDPEPETVAVTGVTLNTNAVTLNPNGTASLTANVLPSNATNKAVTWTSSNMEVATVADGVVTALKAGTATITVTTADGNKTATCAVTVQPADVTPDPEPETVQVTGVTLDQTAVTLKIGGTISATLRATVAPENATNKSVVWTSSNMEVATVADGVVTALKAGTATITVTTADGNKTATCTVTVQPADVTPDPEPTPDPTEPTVESVIVTSVNGATTVANGGSLQLNASVVGTNNPAQTVTWSIKSGATATGATVANGLLSAGTVAGTVTVVATSTVDNTIYGEITITVQAASTPDPTPSDYTADGTYTLDIAGGTATGIYIVDNAAGNGFATALDGSKYFKLSSSGSNYDCLYINVKLQKNKIITITGTARPSTSGRTATLGITPDTSSTGTVSGLGNVSISAEMALNQTYTVTQEGVIKIALKRASTTTGVEFLSFSVTISSPEPENVQSVSLDKTTSALKVGATETLTATVAPANADNTNVLWTSSDNTIATVDANGVVTAIKKGEVTITATSAADSTKKASCVYTITNVAPTSVTLNRTSAVVEIGDTVSLTATVLPANATIRTVSWTSSDETVATVDNNGVVTAKAAGNVTITATATDDSNVKATCSIEVKTQIIDVTGISLDVTSVAKYVGDTLQLNATITPDNADDKSVEWSTSNASVATVSANGLVTIVGEGTVTITATSSISTIKAECVITSTYIRYTVNFKDGSNTVKTQSVIKGEKATRENLTKEGYALVGWYTDSALTSKFDFNTAITADTTLYAKWEKSTMKITYSMGNFESAAIEWDDKNASSAKVEYKLASAEDSAYVEVDNELIRQIDADTARVDVLGLKGGVNYTFKITASSKGVATQTLAIKSYDRSGYAHFNYNKGVGAYNDDGTLKDNAIVLYVTDKNKNTVTLTYGGITVTGIGNILNTTGMDAGSGTNAKGGKANTNQGILKVLADANIPLVVRFIGCVSDSGLYKSGSFTAANAPLINGLSVFDGVDYGGSVGDNGHMARMKSGKDITLEGVGEDATIDGWGFHFICSTTDRGTERGTSFEVRNLIFINTPEDAVGMEGTQGTLKADGTVENASSATADILGSVERCWVHNNEFYCPNISGPAESDKAQGDGSCDFKRGQYFTCSYNYFEGCHKTNLVGSSDSSLQYNLTYHHNYWYLCEARGPLARQANIHMYNNVFDSQISYAMNPRANAYIFSEYNLFYNSKSPQSVAGGALKSYNDSFSSCINDMNGTIVTDKSQTVSNNCKFVYRNIDYSKFDTTASQSYIPDGNYQLQENITEARKYIEAYCGVTKRNAKAVEDITMSDLSYLPSGVTPVAVTTYPSEVAPGKISKTVYAFKLDRSATVTVSMSGGVLVNEAGECLLSASGSVVLMPGIYMVQPMAIQPGDASTLKPAVFKEVTITKIAYEVFNSAELDDKLIAEYDAKATLVQEATIAYDTASYQLIHNAQNAYASLSAELKAQVTVPYSVVENAFAEYVSLGVTEVEGKINAIGTVDENSGSKITAARNAYSQLISVAPSATVSNYAKLTAAETAYENYKVQGLINQINDLADPATATTEEAITSLLEEYNNVKSMYEGLSDEQKTQVTNYSKVTSGIATLTAASAPYDVKAMIAALPAAADVTRADATAITAARTAYDVLTADQKAVVGDITKLEAAEAALGELAANTVVAIFARDESNKALALPDGFSLTGTKSNYADGKTYTYNGTTYSDPLKLESGTKVTFVLATQMKVTIVTSASGKVNVDGASKTSTGTLELTLDAGSHTIEKGDSMNLYYVILEAVA